MLTEWRKKHLHIPLKAHSILFLCTFFIGVLLANLRWPDESFWLGYQVENALKQFTSRDLSRSAFPSFLLKYRLPVWTVLCLPGCFYRGEGALFLFSGWTGLALGVLSATLARQFSILGIPLIGALLFPQILAYLPAYILLIQNKLKRSAVYALKCILLSGIFLAGVLGEYFLNPWFLEKMYAVISAVSSHTT